MDDSVHEVASRYLKTASKFHKKTAIVEQAGDKLSISFMAEIGRSYASLKDLDQTLKDFDKEVLAAQSIPLPSGSGSYKTIKQGVVALGRKYLSVFITREFKWSGIKISYESYYDADWKTYTDQDVLKEVLMTLGDLGWKTEEGYKIASLKTALLSEGQWAAKQIEECLETLEGVVVTLEARGRSGDYEADASTADTYREAAEAVKLIRHKVSVDLDKAAKWLKKIR